jgi:2-oxoglutarate dehydrogenase E2 component (dihydrolipoamide succinyltransferase)
MKVEIKIPSMGESITEATVGTILKPSGSKVAMDEEILELETDKVNQVLYAPQAGEITLNISADDVVKIGQVIGYVDSEGGGVAQKKEPEELEKKEKSESQKAPEKKQAPQDSSSHEARVSKESFVKEVTSPKKEKEKTKEEEDTKGSEKTEKEEPKVSKKEPASEKDTVPSPKIEKPVSSGKRETRRRMTKIRRVIAQRLVEAQQTTAMLTTFNEVDLSAVMDLRAKYKDYFIKEYNVKLGFMSFFVKATVSALTAFPDVNSYVDGEDIVHRDYYDIGIAVGTERGLIVPVVRNCEKLSFAEIERLIEGFAKKAREGSISVDDLQGGGFTITNGGTYGSLLSTPILNPPQSGILGMHKIEKRPVVINDEIVIRPMMYLALSYDHRVIDGKEAVSFLVHVKNCLEDPSRLLLGV